MVNETAEPVTVELQTFLVSLAGEKMPLTAAAGTCSPDRAATLLSVAASEIPRDTVLFWSFEASNGMSGEGHHVEGTYKALDLEPSGIAISAHSAGDGTYELTVSATGLALHVMLEADVEGRYSDNAFDLTAGESRVIRFKPKEQLAAGRHPVFKGYDLQSCQGNG